MDTNSKDEGRRVDSFLRDGSVGEPGEARGDEGAGKADDRDAVKSDARPGLAPAVGEDVDLEAGVCRRADRQLGREGLRAPHEAEAGDDNGDLFSCFHRSFTGRPIRPSYVLSSA